MNPLLARLRYHVTGAIERGEAKPITEIPYMKTFIIKPDRRVGYFTPEDITSIEIGGFVFSPSNRVAYLDALVKPTNACLAEHGDCMTEYHNRAHARAALGFDPFITPDPREHNIVETKHPLVCSLTRVRLNQGGYDRDGTYWGTGKPLFYAQADEEIPDLALSKGYHIRAFDRENAKHLIQCRFSQSGHLLLNAQNQHQADFKREYRKIVFKGDKGVPSGKLGKRQTDIIGFLRAAGPKSTHSVEGYRKYVPSLFARGLIILNEENTQFQLTEFASINPFLSTKNPSR